MALVDAGYKYIFIDICGNRSYADNIIFEDSGLPEALQINILIIPPPKPSKDGPISYSVIADDAFPLRRWLLKPYPLCGLDT